ncbi:MAG TPA: hypothetical protein VGO43_15240 [Pyrinomonadaceae bacterium]|jgi:hypothetical protein|nr:hypothetical protein [Pyrinomonadaceae bacterium]
MKKEAFTVGQTIEQMCSACDVEQKHVVRTATKQGTITEVACEACETVTKYSRGVKTAVNMGKAKNAAPYDRTRSYRKGQTMTHDTFGRGEVTGVEAHKMDVLFGDRSRRMIHAQN